MEPEMHEIPDTAVNPQGPVKLGSLLADIGRRVPLSAEEFALFEQVSDEVPSRSVSYD